MSFLDSEMTAQQQHLADLVYKDNHMDTRYMFIDDPHFVMLCEEYVKAADCDFDEWMEMNLDGEEEI